MSTRTLPDVSRLLQTPADVWLRLRDRLQEIGLTEKYAGQVTCVGHIQLAKIDAPMQNWNAGRLREPAAFAARMFMLEDPVPEEEARAALGADLVEALREAGLLIQADGHGVVSPFELVVAEGLYLFGDLLEGNEDAVMGATSTTRILSQASQPMRPVGQMLDLGCGAGSFALLHAGRAQSVVGTDINERAIVLSRLNAMLNGIGNVEFRAGDLFAPVPNERWDLIVSQPPWFAQPASAEGRVYLFGGSRGDEISLRILRELPAHLNEHGRAVLLIEWPVIDDDPIEERIAQAIPQAGHNVLLLKFPAKELDDYCTRYAALEHPGFGPEFVRSAVERREHLERLGVHALQLTIMVIQRNPDGLDWADSFDVPAADVDFVTAARIEKMIAARDLLTGDMTQLLAVRLRVPEDTVIAHEHLLGKAVPPRVSARFPRGALVGGRQLGPGAQLLLTLMTEAPDVQSAIRRYADTEKLDFEAAFARLLPPIRESLLSGMLEIG